MERQHNARLRTTETADVFMFLVLFQPITEMEMVSKTWLTASHWEVDDRILMAG